MNIAVVQSFLPSRSNGGVGHFAHQLANALAQRQHEVTVFSLDPPVSDAAYVVIRPNSDKWLFRGLPAVICGFALWLSHRDYSNFDVIHAMGDNQFLTKGKPVVRTIHGAALAEARHAPKLSRKAMFLAIYLFELVAVARASVAVGVSRNSIAYFPWVRRVITEAVDLHAFSPSISRSPAPSILFVGHRLRDRKRAQLLLDEFQKSVRPNMPDAELWLVLDDVVQAPGIRSFSKLPIEELAHLYRQAWVFCLPSSYEGFGRPYVEAMASGTPIVATRNPGATEVLDNGRFGVIAADDNLGCELVALLGDAARRAALSTAGLARAPAFDWSAAVDQYERLYAEVISRRPTNTASAR